MTPLNCSATIVIGQDGKKIVKKQTVKTNRLVKIKIDADLRLWSPEDPFLYDLFVELKSGDRVKSYFGMRKIETRKVGEFQRIFLNNKLLTFQAGPLDQGISYFLKKYNFKLKRVTKAQL